MIKIGGYPSTPIFEETTVCYIHPGICGYWLIQYTYLFAPTIWDGTPTRQFPGIQKIHVKSCSQHCFNISYLKFHGILQLSPIKILNATAQPTCSIVVSPDGNGILDHYCHGMRSICCLVLSQPISQDLSSNKSTINLGMSKKYGCPNLSFFHFLSSKKVFGAPM